MGKRLVIALIGGLGLLLLLLYFKGPFRPGTETRMGVSFSKYLAERLENDWKENYLAVLDDFDPAFVRIPVFWEDVEPEPGEYIFTDYDWMIREAQKREVPVILAIGRSAGGPQRCFAPAWFDDLDEEIRRSKTLALVNGIVKRYEKTKGIEAWQLESQPFFALNKCFYGGGRFLAKEKELIRKTDSGRPVWATDNGEWGSWVRVAGQGEVLGISFNWDLMDAGERRWLGWFFKKMFWTKAALASHFRPDQEILVYQLKAGPGADDRPWEEAFTTSSRRRKRFSLDKVINRLEWARELGFSRVSVDGTEWWFWLKKQGQSDYWQAGKDLLKNS